MKNKIQIWWIVSVGWWEKLLFPFIFLWKFNFSNHLNDVIRLINKNKNSNRISIPIRINWMKSEFSTDLICYRSSPISMKSWRNRERKNSWIYAKAFCATATTSAFLSSLYSFCSIVVSIFEKNPYLFVGLKLEPNDVYNWNLKRRYRRCYSTFFRRLLLVKVGFSIFFRSRNPAISVCLGNSYTRMVFYSRIVILLKEKRGNNSG